MDRQTSNSNQVPTPDGQRNDIDLSVIILTKNEEVHVERAIKSLLRYPGRSEVWVVDSFSSDLTVKRSEEAGATVVQHEFSTHAKQLQWAMSTLPLRGAWTMRLDADEVPDATLLTHLFDVTHARPDATPVGLECVRSYVFMGRKIAHGGRSSQRTLRVWRTGQAHVEDRAMDEHVIVPSGRIGILNGELRDENLKGISEFLQKHILYAKREAYDVLSERLATRPSRDVDQLASRQAKLKRIFKTRIYNKIPGPLGPLLLFTWRYLFLGGFRDGVEGFNYHLLQSVWYRTIVQIEIAQARKLLRANQIDASDDSLSEHFGLAKETPSSVEAIDG